MLRLLLYSSLDSGSDMCAAEETRYALHMEERAMTHNDDGSYCILLLLPFEDPLGVNPKRLR